MKLTAEAEAPPTDPLGRSRVGYSQDLTPAELWERGRGAWKAKARNIVACDVLLITHGGIVEMAGTIEGLTKHADGRLAVIGTPLPDHPLIGTRDPLDNGSANPVTYGTINGGPNYTHLRTP